MCSNVGVKTTRKGKKDGKKQEPFPFCSLKKVEDKEVDPNSEGIPSWTHIPKKVSGGAFPLVKIKYQCLTTLNKEIEGKIHKDSLSVLSPNGSS